MIGSVIEVSEKNMNDALTPISPMRALYIKLGPAGSWEEECLEDGIVRFDYRETSLEAISGDWDAVLRVWKVKRPNAGAATADLTQIKHFFLADEKTLWVTFSRGFLWWCFVAPGVEGYKDGEGTFRKCVDGWRNVDIRGNKLSMDKLSGNLLRVQGFRGTICDVKAFDYLNRKINGKFSPQLDEADQARAAMIEKINPLMGLLTWQDFELLVDLVFSNSGWRRVSQVGKTQKTVDIELLLPTTDEHAFVQIKSEATKEDLAKYKESLKKDSAWSRMFFVWHTGKLEEKPESDSADVTLIGPKKLARMVFDAGLTSWLMDKVS